MNILIIDDERDICFLLGCILTRRQLPSTIANTLTEAVIAIRQQLPDIVFIDNHLPDGLGMDFLTYLKENCPLSKIIMISAFDTSIDRKMALTRGVDVFIGKPFSMATIHSAIDAVVA